MKSPAAFSLRGVGRLAAVPALRLVITCVTALLLSLATAQEGSAPAGDEEPDANPTAQGSVGEAFASLVITSAGEQTYDITTGLTTLPDGGTVYDARTGVEVEAVLIRFVEGEYIEADGVVVSGEFGSFQADNMRVDLVTSVLSASGDLWLARSGLTIVAGSLEYFADEDVMVFDGGVQGNDPEFYADRLLLDVSTGDVLLDGQYTFTGTLFTMRSPQAGGRLHLRPEMNGQEQVYAAATEVSPALLQRFSAYL